jgi:hypothetical protein
MGIYFDKDSKKSKSPLTKKAPRSVGLFIRKN